jgi:ornithine cyclodeaminase/alanine dehydrogenase-like protein (mu-crystallin family)
MRAVQNMKILILNQSEIAELLSMEECMIAMEMALLALDAGDAILPLRQLMWLPGHESLMAVMPAFSNASKSMGVKVISVFPRNRGTQYDSHQGAILLFETGNGQLLAILDASEITAMRTAAVSGVATRALSRPDSSELAILGSGVQAHTHLQAMMVARKLKRVRVWSRTPSNAERFCLRESERYSVLIEPVADPKEAVTGADIICTVTASRTPVLAGEWISPGAHINAVGTFGPDSREIDTATVVRSRLFVDRRESALNEAGDFIIPRNEGLITEEHIRGELGELLAGKISGRTSSGEVTLFKSLGLAIEDLATAQSLYDKALWKGRGTWVELGGSRHES